MEYDNFTDKKLAVLIDADNISYRYIKYMMAEISKYGTPTYKRIYGDWTQPNLSNWKMALLENAITPIQQYSYTTRKNSTDSALIIDAMDILYSNNVEGFCIVSSDSDFTRLATRLREAGKFVIGIGENKTPSAFITACEKFIYLEVLIPHSDPPQKTVAANTKGTSAIKNNAKTESMKNLISLISSVVEDVADEDGWAFLSKVGDLLGKRQPDFDPRNYGFMKLGKLIAQIDEFDIDIRSTSNPNVKHLYIRNK